MTITLLFFGATADAVGSRKLELIADEAATARSLIDELSNEHPALRRHQLLIAINEEYSDADAILTDRDEVALFTAVSGG